MKSIALTQNKDKQFVINYSEGVILREDSEIAFAKHNLLCFGRLDRNLTKDPLLRRGSASSVFENRELYSTSQ